MLPAKGAVRRRVSDRFGAALGRHDSTLPLLSFFPKLRSSMIVGPDTEVCVEGYPRSANTFSYAALVNANPGLEIAHHIHRPAQITRAARFGVPCVVLVREPAAAIASHLVFKRGQSSLRSLIDDYVDFYARASAPIASGAAAVCRFEDATSSTRAVSELLNSRFGCGLDHCRLSVDELRQSLARFDRQPARNSAAYAIDHPAESRQELVDRVREEPRFERALEVYAALSAGGSGMRAAAPA